MQLGLDAFKAQLGNLSITTDIPPYPSAMLGAIDLSPMQMLGMYQIFANGGAYTPIHTIRTVIDDNGRVLQRSQPRHQFRAPPQAVYLLNRGLQEVIKSGTAKAPIVSITIWDWQVKQAQPTIIVMRGLQGIAVTMSAWFGWAVMIISPSA